jgi:hypothetical protein
MARKPAQKAAAAQKTAEQLGQKVKYFILDEKAEQIAGKNITDKHREDGIELSEAEAMFYTASGTIGTEDPKKSKAAQRAVDANDGVLPEFKQVKQPSKPSAEK